MTPAAQPPGHQRARRQRGIAVIITACAMMVLVPILGLAIDVSFLYSVRARLAAAADASALAAARSIDEAPSAVDRAEAIVRANFPEGFLNTSNLRVRVDVGAQTVRVTVAVDAPTFFLGAIGIQGTTVRASGQAAEAGGSYSLVG